MNRYDRTKRAIDVIAGGTVLIVSAPLQLALALMVKRRLGSPVLFRQERPGKDGVIFELIKFRTMLEPDPDNGRVSDEARMTPLGALLRSTSLDELPTLWNVVKGDMSIVGPRPLLVQYLGRYSPEQLRRHDVRPGVTGLAQVSGRNALSWEEKFAKDVEYVDSRSLAVDMKIVLRTISQVLKRDGVSAEGHATMAEFMGGGHG